MHYKRVDLRRFKFGGTMQFLSNLGLSAFRKTYQSVKQKFQLNKNFIFVPFYIERCLQLINLYEGLAGYHSARKKPVLVDGVQECTDYAL